MRQFVLSFSSFLLLTLLCTCGPAQNTLSAQLRLTIDGGIAIANFDQKPVLPARTRTVFGLTDDQTYKIEPLESGYVGIGIAHHPQENTWGWSTRLQFMKRGYRFVIDGAPIGSPRSENPAQSYVSFIDLMAQATRTLFGKLRINAGPYLSFALHDRKYPTLNQNGPDTVPYTRTDYGVNAGVRYPFGRLSITADYQLGLRRHDSSSLNEAFITASGLSDYVALQRNPRISALRVGLEFAIWE